MVVFSCIKPFQQIKNKKKTLSPHPPTSLLAKPLLTQKKRYPPIAH